MFYFLPEGDRKWLEGNPYQQYPPGYGQQPQYFAGLLVAPNGGLLWYWPSAAMVLGLGLAAAVRGHGWSDYVTRTWAAEEAAFERGDLDAAVEVNLETWVDGPDRSPDEVDPEVRSRVAEMQRNAFELALDCPDAQEEVLVLDIGDRLDEISVPTLAVVGEYDVPDVHMIAERLEREIGATRVTIDGAAHLPNLEQPREFDDLVLAFLAGLEAE